MEKQIEQIIDWLRTETEKAKAKGLLVGVSGGLDSAVVAYLIQRAFPNDSLGVIMPLKSNPVDVKDANEVVQQSNINHLTIDLSESHKLMYGEIQKQIKENGQLYEEKDQIADANLRARLRMSTLYTVGTNYNYLVVGTDNLSEWHTGYFTKYGDGGVDLQPILPFTKTEVFEMARVLGVPDSVISKMPSADLWEGQTDEAEMGVSYAELDAYLQNKQVSHEAREKIEQMHERTAHKRRMPNHFEK